MTLRFATSSMCLKQTAHASPISSQFMRSMHMNTIPARRSFRGVRSPCFRCPTAKSIPIPASTTTPALARSAAETDADARRELGWLFGGRRDLWSVALNAITDSEWFTVFQDAELWSAEDAAWVIPAWIAKNFEDWDRLEVRIRVATPPWSVVHREHRTAIAPSGRLGRNMDARVAPLLPCRTRSVRRNCLLCNEEAAREPRRAGQRPTKGREPACTQLGAQPKLSRAS